MRKLITLVMVLAGCSTYFGDDVAHPDAAVAPTAADAAVCEPGLPHCASLGCGVGAVPLDCPRPEDATAPCYCPAPSKASWCFQ